jgi:hypothetical protein
MDRRCRSPADPSSPAGHRVPRAIRAQRTQRRPRRRPPRRKQPRPRLQASRASHRSKARRHRRQHPNLPLKRRRPHPPAPRRNPSSRIRQCQLQPRPTPQQRPRAAGSYNWECSAAARTRSGSHWKCGSKGSRQLCRPSRTPRAKFIACAWDRHPTVQRRTSCRGASAMRGGLPVRSYRILDTAHNCGNTWPRSAQRGRRSCTIRAAERIAGRLADYRAHE